MLHMERYPYSRYWAVWDDQDLVAVVVYKKGAAEILRRLQMQPPHAPAPAPAPVAPAPPPARRWRSRP